MHYSKATFLILPNGYRISYGSFLGQAAQYPNVIGEAGLKAGDRLAMDLQQRATQHGHR